MKEENKVKVEATDIILLRREIRLLIESINVKDPDFEVGHNINKFTRNGQLRTYHSYEIKFTSSNNKREELPENDDIKLNEIIKLEKTKVYSDVVHYVFLDPRHRGVVFKDDEGKCNLKISFCEDDTEQAYRVLTGIESLLREYKSNLYAIEDIPAAKEEHRNKMIKLFAKKTGKFITSSSKEPSLSGSGRVKVKSKPTLNNSTSLHDEVLSNKKPPKKKEDDSALSETVVNDLDSLF